MTRPPPRSTLFPYTTLFRSLLAGAGARTVSRSDTAQCANSPDARSARESRSEEHTSELQSLTNLVCRLLLEKKKHEDPRAAGGALSVGAVVVSALDLRPGTA